MSSNETEIIKISRLLTPEHQADLLDWVHLAQIAENSARKSMGCINAVDGALALKSKEYSCGSVLHRGKK